MCCQRQQDVLGLQRFPAGANRTFAFVVLCITALLPSQLAFSFVLSTKGANFRSRTHLTSLHLSSRSRPSKLKGRSRNYRGGKGFGQPPHSPQQRESSRKEQQHHSTDKHQIPLSIPFLPTGNESHKAKSHIQNHSSEGQSDHGGSENLFSSLISHVTDIHHTQARNIKSHLRPSPLVSATSEWQQLQKHADNVKKLHLRNLLADKNRCDAMFSEHDGAYLDYSRQRVTHDTMDLLEQLAKKQQLKEKIDAMLSGEKINFTEDRAVLHTALRADKSQIGTVFVDGMDAVKEVHEVLRQVKMFTDDIRSGTIRGYTGKRLRNIISVGIGGSYLGPEFLHECLKTDPEGINSALGYSLRFLANIDPVDVERACADLDPEETLILIVSKTFTTAETMLNARTMRQWLWDFMGNDKEVVRKHIAACASVSSIDKVAEFGIDTENYFFRFWDWVGGRYSVCSAVGAVPISLQYGFDLFEKFLMGAKSIDDHFATAPFKKNIPVIMGMLGIWNMSFLNYKARTTMPYAEALLKLPAHIQQLDMESNGKSVTKDGLEVDYNVGEVDFGEPGTNGQHSFFQLLHMGQTIPCDFIGFVQSQNDLCVDGEKLSSHDELMSNFFAQPDALAKGKTANEVRAEGVPEELVPHKTFSGNRPSSSLLLPQLTAYTTGQLLAIYEHRTAVQGFIWDINSFDQWGVELGKKLALDIKTQLQEARANPDQPIDTGNPATTRLLQYYVDNSMGSPCDELCGNSVTGKSVTAVSRKRRQEHGTQSREHVPPSSHDLGGNTGKLS